jgi:putative heme-binding domain-containing protein
MVIAYLRKIGTVPPSDAPGGNVDNGARLFTAQCASCHRVAGKGGRIGPDLTRVGTSRSRSALVREIRTPSEWIPPAFETVSLVTKDGQRIRGIKKNEDVFSIQVMDTRERIQGYLKSDLKELVYEKTSLMPAFPAGRLYDSDLNDLMVIWALRGGSHGQMSDSSVPFGGTACVSDDHPVLRVGRAGRADRYATHHVQDLLDGLKDQRAGSPMAATTAASDTVR